MRREKKEKIGIFDGFCGEVASHMRRATPWEAEDIRRELYAHLVDHAEAAMDGGRSEDEARAHAVKAMGSAGEIAAAYDAQLSRLWRCVQLCANALTALALALTLFAAARTVRDAAPELRARADIDALYESGGYEIHNEIDVKLRVPNSDQVIEFICCDVYPDGEGGYEARVGVTVYSRNPFAAPERAALAYLALLTPEGETRFDPEHVGTTLEEGEPRGFGEMDCYAFTVPVRRGQRTVEAVWSLYGEYVSVGLPADWEGVE